MSEGNEPSWDDALSEQAAASGAMAQQPEAADDWAAALAEQTAAESPAPRPAAPQVFAQIPAQPQPIPDGELQLERIKNIPVQLTTELGRTRITIKELLQLSQGSVVELDGLAGQPLDVKINGYLIAQGEVVQVNDKYGIRLTDIVLPSERIQKLARQ